MLCVFFGGFPSYFVTIFKCFKVGFCVFLEIFGCDGDFHLVVL